MEIFVKLDKRLLTWLYFTLPTTTATQKKYGKRKAKYCKFNPKIKFGKLGTGTTAKENCSSRCDLYLKCTIIFNVSLRLFSTFKTVRCVFNSTVNYLYFITPKLYECQALFFLLMLYTVFVYIFSLWRCSFSSHNNLCGKKNYCRLNDGYNFTFKLWGLSTFFLWWKDAFKIAKIWDNFVVFFINFFVLFFRAVYCHSNFGCFNILYYD